MKEVVPRTSFFTTIGKELKQRRIFTTESHRGVHSPRRVYDSSKEKRFILLLKSRTILINKKLSSQSSQRRTKDAKRTVRK